MATPPSTESELLRPKQTVAFMDRTLAALVNRTLQKLTLSKPTAGPTINIYVRPVELKGKLQWHVVFRTRTNETSENLVYADLVQRLGSWLDCFGAGVLRTSDAETYYDVQNPRLRTKTVGVVAQRSTVHDKVKTRHVHPSTHWMLQLGLTTPDGAIVPAMSGKYRQVERYIDLLASALDQLGKRQLRICDLGAGKGYLSFALYDYLRAKVGIEPELVAVERRPDLCEKGNEVARQCGFTQLRFQHGEIADFPLEGYDVMMALHACDTATDDALALAMNAEVPLIVVAPCCHKQVRKDMIAAPKKWPMLAHGLFLERQAELLTDTIRSLYLESRGYAVSVAEFVGSEHTAKNVMIIARKIGPSQNVSLSKIDELKAAFGLRSHALDTLLVKAES